MLPDHSLERTQPERAIMDGVELLLRSARSRWAMSGAIENQGSLHG